jgi:hypothetical protein
MGPVPVLRHPGRGPSEEPCRSRERPQGTGRRTGFGLDDEREMADGVVRPAGRRTGRKCHRRAAQIRTTATASAAAGDRRRAGRHPGEPGHEPFGGETSVWTTGGEGRMRPRSWPGYRALEPGTAFRRGYPSGSDVAGSPSGAQTDRTGTEASAAAVGGRGARSRDRRAGSRRWSGRASAQPGGRRQVSASPEGVTVTNHHGGRVSARASGWGRAVEVAEPASRQDRQTEQRFGAARGSGTAGTSPEGSAAEPHGKDGLRSGRVEGATRWRSRDRRVSGTGKDAVLRHCRAAGTLGSRPTERPQQTRRGERDLCPGAAAVSGGRGCGTGGLERTRVGRRTSVRRRARRDTRSSPDGTAVATDGPGASRSWDARGGGRGRRTGESAQTWKQPRPCGVRATRGEAARSPMARIAV